MSEQNDNQNQIQNIQQQQSQQGRGRGRRGRGGGRNVGNRAVQTYGSDSMARYINSFSVMANPVVNHYMVDVANILSMFLVFDGFIIHQPTRSAWRHAGYYAGLMMYAFASRLQRIGIRYHQCLFDGRQMINVEMLELPSCIATLIEQFGYVEDDQGFVLIPKVTTDLILFLHRLGYDLMMNQGNIATLVVRNNLDFISFMAEGYTGSHAATYSLCMISNFLGYPAPVTGVSVLDRNTLHAYLLTVTCHNAGLNVTQQVLDQLYPINNAHVVGNDAYCFRGGQVPAVNPPYSQAFVDAINNARNAFGVNRGNAAFNNGNWGSNRLRDDVTIPFNDLEYAAELVKLKVVFTCRKLNQDVVGTKAPLVAVDNAGVAKPTALMVGTTAQEFYYGMALESFVVTITPTERFYNVENPSRRRFRYLGAPASTSVAGVRGALILSDVIVRK